jgi:two-component system response regulator
MKRKNWILLAEDDVALAELTTIALAADKLECDVVVVPDGQKAMEALHHRGKFLGHADGLPIFVLLDLKMPKMDGLEVLQQIKSDEQLKHIPVIMFSSSREVSDVALSYQLGANAYVVKPTSPHEFQEVLGAVGKFWATINELPQETRSQHKHPASHVRK